MTLFRDIYMQKLQQWILSVAVSIVGGFGNGILLMGNYRRKTPLQGKMKVAMHFIAVLAAVDFTVCSIILPIEIITFMTGHRSYPDVACKFFGFGRLTGLYASNFLLVGIAVDRFISVCFPFSVGIDYRMAKYITVASIVAAFVVASPNLYLFQVIESPDMKEIRCQMTEVPELELARRTITFTHLSIYVISVITIVVLYLLVYKTVRQKERKRIKLKSGIANVRPKPVDETCCAFEMENQQDPGPSTSKFSPLSSKTAIGSQTGGCCKKLIKSAQPTSGPLGTPPPLIVNCKEKKAENSGPGVASRTAFMLLLVTAVFVLSWLPYWVINLMAMTSYFHDVAQPKVQMALMFNSLFYINNAVNPIIYTFASSNFRNDIKDHVFCSTNKACAA